MALYKIRINEIKRRRGSLRGQERMRGGGGRLSRRPGIIAKIVNKTIKKRMR